MNGALWAPHSDFVAVTKVDRRGVPLYPIVHWLKPATEVEWVHLAYSGSALPKPEYYIIDVGSKKQVRIDAGDGAVFFRAWRPDDSGLLLTRQGPCVLRVSSVCSWRIVSSSPGASDATFTRLPLEVWRLASSIVRCTLAMLARKASEEGLRMLII